MDGRELVELLLSGHCAAYAVAAARALEARGGRNVGITLMLDDDGEPNTPDDRCAVHAYASCDAFDCDAGGVLEPEAMADRYGLQSWSVDGPFREAEFLSFFCSGDDGLEADPHWISASADLIERRPDLVDPSARRRQGEPR